MTVTLVEVDVLVMVERVVLVVVRVVVVVPGIGAGTAMAKVWMEQTMMAVKSCMVSRSIR